MNKIQELIELVPKRHKLKALKVIRAIDDTEAQVAQYLDKNTPVVDKVNSALITAFGCTIEQLATSGRAREHVDLRKIAVNYIYSLHCFSLTQIGKLFNKDHATVIHYCKQHEQHVKYDAVYRDKNNLFLTQIQNNDKPNYSHWTEDTISATLDVLRNRAYNS